MYKKATLPNEDVVESDPSTTKAYLESEEEDNPTIGDMTSSFGNVALIDSDTLSFSSSIPNILTFTC
jgi:hypothetical protein